MSLCKWSVRGIHLERPRSNPRGFKTACSLRKKKSVRMFIFREGTNNRGAVHSLNTSPQILVGPCDATGRCLRREAARGRSSINELIGNREMLTGLSKRRAGQCGGGVCVSGGGSDGSKMGFASAPSCRGVRFNRRRRQSPSWCQC